MREGTLQNIDSRCSEGCRGKQTGRRHLWELGPELTALSLVKPLPAAEGRLARVHILALGDVGSSLLLGLKVLGSGTIGIIGIYDVNEKVMARYEMEMNQIGWAFEELETAEGGAGPLDGPAGVPGTMLPQVVTLTEETLFDCDLFLFCASKSIPAIGVKGDVRMMQFDANRQIVEHFAKKAKAADYQGIFAVVSDPVDPLCKAALLASGLKPGQIRGYGLGVMNRRAVYFSKKDERMASYPLEGRAFGPHGGDLVIANSIENYDDALSGELTKLTVEANLAVRELGFKPYLAPALSSGAMSVIRTLRGQWHYSSIYLGQEPEPDTDGTSQWTAEGAFLGVKNRIDGMRLEYEDLELPEELFARIRTAYGNLCRII